ncbi:MAG: hypothetical protein EU517_00260 [Promethearchaeota archaeon]|nr:MAG: hypothetical protein EU517_00260 [Candidatus Lokiarchaeota archaeon]
MPATYIIKKMIKQELTKLKNPITIKVFIKEDEELRAKEDLAIIKDYEENSEGKLKLDVRILKNGNSRIETYQINRTPTIILTDPMGNELIRYLAAPQGSEVKPFLQSLQILSGAKNYYEDIIKKNLRNIQPSIIKVLVTKSCAYCPQLVNLVSQFALGTMGKVKAEIIDILKNPDIGNYYDIDTVPYIVINDGEPIIGMVNPDELLKSILIE